MLKSVLIVFCWLPATSSFAAIEYDQSVTPNVIFGTGNVNGGFTTDRAEGLELGLRANARFPAPSGQFNSHGDGTYSHNTGNDAGHPLWIFEWSINTSWDGTKSLRFLRDLVYELRIDTDPGASTSFFTFDPINSSHPATGYWDHAIGDQFTGNGGGEVSTSQSMYNGLIANKHVAQNSWGMNLFPFSFDPNAAGIYTIELAAYPKSTSTPIASVSIQVFVEGVESGTDGAMPEPITFLTWAGLIGCATVAASRCRR